MRSLSWAAGALAVLAVLLAGGVLAAIAPDAEAAPAETAADPGYGDDYDVQLPHQTWYYTKDYDVTAGETLSVNWFGDMGKSYFVSSATAAGPYITIHTNYHDTRYYLSDVNAEILVPTDYSDQASAVYTVVLKVYFIEGILGYLYLNEVTFNLHVTFPSWSVTLNGNGGTVGGSSVSVLAAERGSSVTLPVADRSGYTFGGWYTAASGGTVVGNSGDSYTPSGDVTFYAHWTYVPTYTIFTNGSSYSVQISSGSVFSYTAATSPSGASVSVTSWGELGGLLSLSGKTISGTLTDVLPGDYYLRIYAKSTSTDYGSYQTIHITVPVTVFDPITATVNLGENYTYNLTATPSSAKIASAVVRDNSGSTLDTSAYTITGLPASSVTLTFPAVGVYHVIMTVSATGYTSTTKELVLSVIDPAEDLNAPTYSQITVEKHPSVDGAYYLTVVQPAHYSSISWNCGDNSTQATGASILHQYASNGTKTVTCSIYNKWTDQTVTATATVTVALTMLSPTDAWVSVPYDYSFGVTNGSDGTYAMTAAYEDDATATQNWLTLEKVTDADTGAVYCRLYGTPQATLEGKVLDVTVTYTASGADPVTVKTLAITIWPYVTEDSVAVGITSSVSGYVVTLTNTGTTATGVHLLISWGENGVTSYVRSSSNTTASHDYTSAGAGTYNIKVELVYDNQTAPYALSVAVPSQTTYTITYDPNCTDGAGSMSAQSGAVTYTLSDCGFTRTGYTFAGWNTGPTGAGGAYAAGDGLTPADDLTLYAQWTADQQQGGNGGDDDDNDDGHKGLTKQQLAIIMIVVLLALLALAFYFGLI